MLFDVTYSMDAGTGEFVASAWFQGRKHDGKGRTIDECRAALLVKLRGVKAAATALRPVTVPGNEVWDV